MKFISIANRKEAREIISDIGGLILHFEYTNLKSRAYAASIYNEYVALAWNGQAPVIINAEFDGLKGITVNPGTEWEEKYILG